uniref:cyclin-dependent kinase n=1 Tax=Ditylenchus dipsaci TaxID=166011 RepID=A0A915EGS0_9BILA
MSESRKRILGDGYYSESSAEDAEPILGNEDAAQTSSPSPEVIASRKRVKNINESIHGLKLSASSALNLASDDIIHIDIDFDEPGLIEYNVRPSASSPSNNKDIVIAALQPVSANSMYCPGISGCRHVEEYELLNKIEEGAYGVVYRAREKKTKKMMALKRLKMEKERDGFPITSLREINMLLKCRNHPNIVNLQEVVVDATMDKIFMVMEYVEHDMKSLMNTMKAKSKKFTLPQVKTLLKQLLSGCQYMHEEFVIHRDLKTSNLLMSHNGVLKIGDFAWQGIWTQKYSTAVDMCEIDQLNKIFLEIGTPNRIFGQATRYLGCEKI